MVISVREMQRGDIESIVDYFVHADSDFLLAMGVNKSKLPLKADWIEKLVLEFEKPIEEKEFYYIIWMIDDEAVGHSNINNIIYGQEALMHLHLWNGQKRRKGLGPEFLKLTLPYYFKNFNLKKLNCEPYSKNIAPNKVIKQLGFEFIKEYETIPGWINFLQTVNSYELSSERFEEASFGDAKS